MSHRVRTYVAIGDSFTSGLDPTQNRWPDEVARALGPQVRYENLASVGATSTLVEEEQLPRALALRPDLVSLICGANDVLESVRPDPTEYEQRLGRMFQRLAAELPGVAVVTATYPDLSRFLDLRPRTRVRVEKGMRLFNDSCRRVAARENVLLLEGFDHPAAGHRATFAEDGFHPSPAGHRRAAAEVMLVLRERFDIESGPTPSQPMEEATA